ncbi:MAG: phosphoglucomutase/phosphomannomutase family protein [Dehalococcoidales bacterium]|nr:phosphoglucomutase/phosphomannomutase family protein [Dehalococcoidales bacterium]
MTQFNLNTSDSLVTGRSIKFGTDGWRGIIAEDFTYDNVRLCAQGLADYLRGSAAASRGIVIGYDNRFASEGFAAAAAEVLCANGIRVFLCPRSTPTPVVSYGVVARKAGGAIVITASHNQPIWNGFKYKTGDGASAPSEVASGIEQAVARVSGINRIPLQEATREGWLEEYDITPLYLTRLQNIVDVPMLRQTMLKIGIDPMYGAASGYLRTLLQGGNLDITEIHGERNPIFPGMKQPEPVPANLTALSEAVKQGGWRVGLATDGDADRFGAVDEHGTVLTTLQVFALLCLYFLEVRGERGTIVRTLTQTRMVDRLGEIYKCPVRETRIGFKYLAPVMMAEDAILGGEESGGYGFRGHIPERDGILTSLYFLDLMARTGKTPSELIDHLYGKVGPHHFERRDLEFPEKQRTEITERVAEHQPQQLIERRVVRTDSLDGFRYVLEDGSWLLVRFSGTEPLLRIYAESDSPETVQRLLRQGQEMAGL